MMLVLLTTLLVPFIILSSFGHRYKNPSAFYALILVMQSALVGVFTARDAFLFYLFWEAALIPVYFLAGIWGGEKRIQITFKFFVYTIFGSLFMLLGLAYLYFQAGTSDLEAIYALNLPAGTQSWLFWALFIAFAIKMPVFPFHTWQPDTYTESPTPATMLLSGIMLKMGIYGVNPLVAAGGPGGRCPVGHHGPHSLGDRHCVRLHHCHPSAGHQAHPGVLFLRPRGVDVGRYLLPVHRRDAGGLWCRCWRTASTLWAFSSSPKSFSAGCIRGNCSSSGGITQNTPSLTVFFMILLLGSVALPLTNGFVGEFLLLAGVFKFNPWYAGVAGFDHHPERRVHAASLPGRDVRQPERRYGSVHRPDSAGKSDPDPAGLHGVLDWYVPGPLPEADGAGVGELLKLVVR
jgi:NADH-quinone oxidoreductase subunit M